MYMFRRAIKTLITPFQRYTLRYHRIQFNECVFQSVKIYHLRIIYVITPIVAIWWLLSALSWNFYLHRIKKRSLHLACSYEHKSWVSTSILPATLIQHCSTLSFSFFIKFNIQTFGGVMMKWNTCRRYTKWHTYQHTPGNENEHTNIHWTSSQSNVSCFIHWIRRL